MAVGIHKPKSSKGDRVQISELSDQQSKRPEVINDPEGPEKYKTNIFSEKL
jgi:hypothetical protein